MDKSYNYENEFPPVRIFGNLYFVGTVPASTHILDTGEGLIMFDSGYRHTLHVVLHNMKLMNLNPIDLKYIIHTHGHIDHFGATRELVRLTGAKTVLGRHDKEYADGTLDLSYAKELGMEFSDTFAPDILLDDGDELSLGNARIRAVATPGHTPGAMSYFFDVTDGSECFRAGLHAGSGINTMCREFLDKYGLPYSLRDDFKASMRRLNEERVDIYLGNHMQQNNTEEKAKRVENGDRYAFVDPTEWEKYNLWCIDNLNSLIEKENS